MTDDITPLDFDQPIRVFQPAPRVNDDAAIRERNRAAWSAAQEGAATILDQAGRTFSRATRGIVNPRERILAGLAPLMLFAQATQGNTRRQTLLGDWVRGGRALPEPGNQTQHKPIHRKGIAVVR